MNIRRGLLRFLVVSSILWVAIVGGLAHSIWYGAVQTLWTFSWA